MVCSSCTKLKVSLRVSFRLCTNDLRNSPAPDGAVSGSCAIPHRKHKTRKNNRSISNALIPVTKKCFMVLPGSFHHPHSILKSFLLCKMMYLPVREVKTLGECPWMWVFMDTEKYERERQREAQKSILNSSRDWCHLLI